MEKNRIRPIATGKNMRMSYARRKEVLEMPNLIEIQKNSYKWFLDEGLKEVFDDISPISDYSGHLSLEFVDFELCEEDVKYSIEKCKERDATYAAPLKVKVRLYNKEKEEISEHEIFMGDLTLMTETGTFVINGAERVIVSQLVRSPGIYYGIGHDKIGKKLYSCTVIPNRGAWLEYETDSNDVFYVRVDRTRKVPITVLLRALGLGTNDEIREVFGDEPKIEASFAKDTSENYQEGLLELYKKITTSTGVEVRHKPLGLRIWNNRGYYVMFLPVFIFILIMYYWPMLGIRYAFYDYKPVGAPTFVGLKHFYSMFKTDAFWSAFRNTLELSIMKLLITTFTAVIVSIFLNEMGNLFAKKTLQTIIYLPHFMSWAVVASIFSLFLSPSSTGLVNGLLRDWGILAPDAKGIYFLASTAWWRPIFYIINIWKETGWGTIIFLATLAGINPELYEAADIDGATRMQKMRFVTLPALSNTIITVLILNLAKVMNMFESVFVLYNNAVYSVSDVISTYIYRQTFAIALPNYGYSTAVGLFKSLVGCVLVLICNWASKKTRGRGIV